MDYSNFLKQAEIKEFNNLHLLEEAFTHRSFSKTNNERLEFLGDAVLELAITELLYADFPERTEGDLTSFRAAIVRTESLADEAIKLGLGSLISMSKGEEATGGRDRQYILADVFESVIGALYLDQGYSAAKKFITKFVYYKTADIVKDRKDIDAKSKLQEISQEMFKHTPFYKVVSEVGPDHNKVFTVLTMIGEKEYGSGTGKSKQIAEQEAAKVTLEQLYLESKNEN